MEQIGDKFFIPRFAVSQPETFTANPLRDIFCALTVQRQFKGFFHGARLIRIHFHHAFWMPVKILKSRLIPVRQTRAVQMSAVDFCDWSNTLFIEFHSGGVYEYEKVPRSEYVGLMNAGSHGEYFHAHIKNYYSCTRIH